MRVAATAVAILIVLAGDARTATKTPPPGDIVYAADGALWRVDAGGTQEPRKLALLPTADVEVNAVQASANGRLLVVDLGGIAGWVQPGDGVRKVAVAPCNGPGRPAPDGSKLLCPGGPETTVIQPSVWKARELDVAPEQADFLGPEGNEIVFADDKGVAAVDTRHPKEPRRLAPHAPTSHLMPSPDGKRAVGRYESEDGRVALYTFRLDGKAAKRKLGEDSVPVAWSPDSKWILIHADSIACVARAVGGEYKCWRRYTPLAFSPDSAHVLLARGDSLYTAPIAGVDAVRPTLVVENASPAATWIP